MAKKKLVIEIEFDEEQDEYDEDYTSLEFSSMKINEALSDLSEDDRDQLAERWAQSDWYWVGLCNSLINVIGDGNVVKAKDVKAY